MSKPLTPTDNGFGPVLMEIAELTSESSVVRLVGFLGGKRITFPLNPKPWHRFAVLLGQEHFETLCLHFGGVQIDLPKSLPHQRIARRRLIRSLVKGAGMTDESVAIHLGVSRQYVNRLVHEEGLGIAPLGSLQQFAPTFQLSLDVFSGEEKDSVPVDLEMDMGFFGKAFRVLAGIRKLEGMVREAKQDDGRIDHEEFADIAVFGLMPILGELGIDLFKDFMPETAVGKAAFKGVVEAIESQGDSGA